MEEKYYAVLMSKKILDTGIYFYSPESLIEGEYVEEDGNVYFIDKLGNELIAINNPEMTFSDLERGFGYVISKDDLLARFQGLELEEATAAYFESICSVSHFGFFIYQENVIGVVPMSLNDLSKKLNNSPLPEGDVVQIPISEILCSECNEFGMPLTEKEKENQVECIYMTIDLFEDLLKSKTYEEVMSKLKQIEPDNLQKTNDIEKHEIEEKLLDLFDTGYVILEKTNSIDDIKDIVMKLAEAYVKMTLKFDEFPETKEIDEAKNFFYNLIDTYDKIIEKNDLEEMRKELLELKKASRKNIEYVVKIVDKCYQNEKDNAEKTLNVKDMKDYFDQIIIGQEEAKKDVISSIVMNEVTDDPHSKNSCLLIGPTGSGKTLLAETVSKYLDKPIEIIDTTQQTIPGYQGANIEDFLIRLLNKAGGDLKKAQEGIVVFDEIDKKGSEKNSDISGKGVLNTLLSFLHGTTYDLNYGGRVIPFNTSKLTVFATGAFTEVAKLKKENKTNDNYSGTKIGFNSVINQNNTTEDIVYGKLERQDLVKYGYMPDELIGRFSTITQLSGHTKESLRKILTESTMSPLIQEQAKLVKLNINLTWDEEYLDEICIEALKLKTGARSLKTIVEQTIKNARWQALLNLDYITEIKLSKKTVIDNYNCDLVDNNGNIINLQDLITTDDDVLKRARK